MDNQNIQEPNSNNESTGLKSGQPLPPSVQQNPVAASQLVVNESNKLNLPLLIILILTINVTINVLGLILADIVAGALSGKAETGYGIVFAIFLSPIVIGLLLISFLRIRRLRRNGEKVAKTVKFAVLISIVLSVIGLGYEFGTRIYENHINAPKHAQIQKKIEANKNESISINYATQLLNSCKLVNVYNGTRSTETVGTEVRNSKEGVFLVKVNGQPYNIWVTDNAESSLKTPIDNAIKNCPKFRKS